jgi:NTE family protein
MKCSVADKGIALVLSGGAARCIAQLGFLQAMDESGLKPAAISGVSGGAIVGAFYCNGFSPAEILLLLKKTSILKMFSPTWGTGILKLDNAEDILQQYLKIKDFKSLKTQLFITACDIHNALNVVFSEGDIIKPLIASCSIPPVFKPMEYMEMKLVDGGILNNLPVEPVKNFSKIIGINVNVIDTSAQIDSFALYSERVVDLIVTNNIRESIEHCHHFLQAPEMSRFHITDIGKADEMFAVGYDYMKEKIDEIMPFDKLRGQNFKT